MGREGADGNLESKSLGCRGICCNGRKLVSVEGGGCSKQSILFPRFFPLFLINKMRRKKITSLRATPTLHTHELTTVKLHLSAN